MLWKETSKNLHARGSILRLRRCFLTEECLVRVRAPLFAAYSCYVIVCYYIYIYICDCCLLIYLFVIHLVGLGPLCFALHSGLVSHHCK